MNFQYRLSVKSRNKKIYILKKKQTSAPEVLRTPLLVTPPAAETIILANMAIEWFGCSRTLSDGITACLAVIGHSFALFIVLQEYAALFYCDVYQSCFQFEVIMNKCCCKISLRFFKCGVWDQRLNKCYLRVFLYFQPYLKSHEGSSFIICWS